MGDFDSATTQIFTKLQVEHLSEAVGQLTPLLPTKNANQEPTSEAYQAELVASEGVGRQGVCLSVLWKSFEENSLGCTL